MGFAAAIAHSAGPSEYGTLGDTVGTCDGSDGAADGAYVGSDGVTVGVGVGHGDTGQFVPVAVPLMTNPQLFDNLRSEDRDEDENSPVMESGTEPVR